MEQRELIERCQQGDQQALGQLYSAHHDRLLALCQGYVADSSTAQDLLHDAFVLILGHIGELKDPSRIDGWMHAVTRNVCLLYLKEHSRHTLSLDEVADVIGKEAREPDAVSYNQILRAIDALPRGYRQVFRLSVLDGLSHQDIAELLNIDPHSSSSQLHRAKKLLRQSLRVWLLSLLAVSLPLGWYLLQRKPEVTTADIRVSLPHDEGKTAPQPPAPSPVVPLPRAEAPHEAGNAWQQPPTVPPTVIASVPQAEEPQEERTAEAEQPNAESADTLPTPQRPATMPQADKQVAAIPQRQSPEWSIAMNYSGMGDERLSGLPYGDVDWNDQPADTITQHRMPISFGVQVSKTLGRHFAIATGVQFTQLYSETQTGHTAAYQQDKQRVRYLGLPLRLLWIPVSNGQWRAYGSVGGMMEIPLRSPLERSLFYKGELTDRQHLTLNPSWQWSVGVGAGAEYRLTPAIGIFAEPSLQYFFRRHDGIDTYRSQHPFTLSVPLGLRVTF